MSGKRRGGVLALFVAGAGALAAWTFLGDPARDVGPPLTARVIDVQTPARSAQDAGARPPTAAWTVETKDGRRLRGRSLADLVPETGAMVCVQRTEGERTGSAGLRLVEIGPCP